MHPILKAYLLWLPSFMGVAGLHRFYMGKIGTGILWLCTGGLFGLGTIYDGLTMSGQVREARLRGHMARALDEKLDDLDRYGYSRRPGLEGQSGSARAESPEHVILRVARDNHGIASAAQVALEAGVPTDDARAELDRLVDKGISEVRVRRNGTLVYVFLDFLDATGSADLEQF